MALWPVVTVSRVMPPHRVRPLSLLVIVVASGAAAAARRMERSVLTTPEDGASLPEAVEDLERIVRDAPSKHPAGADLDLQRALVRASDAVARCSEEHSLRRGVLSLVGACADVVHGTSGYSMELKRQALATLEQIAGVGLADEAGLRQIVLLCGDMLVRKEIDGEMDGEILSTLDAVSLNHIRDQTLIQAVLGITSKLVRRRVFSQSWWSPQARFVFESQAIFSRFIERIENDEISCQAVTSASRLILTQTHGVFVYFPARHYIMRTLEAVARSAKSQLVLLEILDTVDLCTNVTESEAMIAPAARILETLARRVDEQSLEQVVGVCGRWLPLSTTQRALVLVVKRLVAGGFPDRAEDVLELLADSFQAHTRRPGKVGTLPCNVVVNLLLEIDQPEAPLHTALHAQGASNAKLSPEVVLYVDGLVPPVPAEHARSRIVEVCARQSKDRLTSARAVFLATCLQPLRVGLGAAQAFAAIARERGAKSLSGVVGADDFAAIGDCLFRNAPKDDGIGAAEAERVAAELVDASVDLLRLWRPARRRWALRSLCALAGDVHVACGPSAWGDE